MIGNFCEGDDIIEVTPEEFTELKNILKALRSSRK